MSDNRYEDTEADLDFESDDTLFRKAALHAHHHRHLGEFLLFVPSGTKAVSSLIIVGSALIVIMFILLPVSRNFSGEGHAGRLSPLDIAPSKELSEESNLVYTDIFVHEGDFVEAGAPLAAVSLVSGQGNNLLDRLLENSKEKLDTAKSRARAMDVLSFLLEERRNVRKSDIETRMKSLQKIISAKKARLAKVKKRQQDLAVLYGEKLMTYDDFDKLEIEINKIEEDISEANARASALAAEKKIIDISANEEKTRIGLEKGGLWMEALDAEAVSMELGQKKFFVLTSPVAGTVGLVHVSVGDKPLVSVPVTSISRSSSEVDNAALSEFKAPAEALPFLQNKTILKASFTVPGGDHKIIFGTLAGVDRSHAARSRFSDEERFLVGIFEAADAKDLPPQGTPMEIIIPAGRDSLFKKAMSAMSLLDGRNPSFNDEKEGAKR